MQAIKNKGSKAEVLLSKGLWHAGIRFRKNSLTVFGKPDVVIKKLKIAIFVDSEFFHGKDWDVQKNRIGTNREFWWKKIEGNIRRDLLVNETLKKEGWCVIRFWDKEVKKNLKECVSIIKNLVKSRKNEDI